MSIMEMTDQEINYVAGGKVKNDDTITIRPGGGLGENGLVVGNTYVRNDGLNVTVLSANSNGSFQIRDNNTGQVNSFTPSGGH